MEAIGIRERERERERETAETDEQREAMEVSLPPLTSHAQFLCYGNNCCAVLSLSLSWKGSHSHSSSIYSLCIHTTIGSPHSEGQDGRERICDDELPATKRAPELPPNDCNCSLCNKGGHALCTGRGGKIRERY